MRYDFQCVWVYSRKMLICFSHKSMDREKKPKHFRASEFLFFFSFENFLLILSLPLLSLRFHHFTLIRLFVPHLQCPLAFSIWDCLLSVQSRIEFKESKKKKQMNKNMFLFGFVFVLILFMPNYFLFMYVWEKNNGKN